MTALKNKHWPCKLVEHDDYDSIICSDFHFFDTYFGEKGGGGYSVEKLAKKLIKENNIKGIQFDSEAGMFCACSQDAGKLLLLCELFRKIIGDETAHGIADTKALLITLEKAEALLIKAFVKDTDATAQKAFLANVPIPALSKNQSGYLDAIRSGTDAEKIFAAKRINSEARTKTRAWNHYLSHPEIVTRFMEALDNEKNPKVYTELIWALVFICDRHMPDLRAQPYFISCLDSKDAQNRWLGLMGMEKLYYCPLEIVSKMKDDKSAKVRDRAASILQTRKTHMEFPPWMFKS